MHEQISTPQNLKEIFMSNKEKELNKKIVFGRRQTKHSPR